MRHAGLPFRKQQDALFEIIMGEPFLMGILHHARELDLPDWWLVSGAIYNTVWNHLTSRPPAHGVKDADLFYFDPSDLSWEAEDFRIRQGAVHFANCPTPVEIKNQARVHLWFKQRFGFDYPVLTCSKDGIDHFASRTHSVGVRLNGANSLELYAPYGLDDIFSFRITPNYMLDNRRTHNEKGERARANWPEIEVVPW